MRPAPYRWAGPWCGKGTARHRAECKGVAMQIRKFPLGPYQTNGYLLSEDGKAVVVDPGDNSPRLSSILREEGLELTHILITHIHIDHFYGAPKLAAETGAKVLASPKDSVLVAEELRNAGESGYPRLKEKFVYEPLHTGTHQFLGRPCHVLATPGHTPGSLTFHFEDDGVAFVGDLIFAGSVGRADYTGGNAKALFTSIESNIFTMAEATVLYPGHGPLTTAGDEKAHNPFFRGRRR